MDAIGIIYDNECCTELKDLTKKKAMTAVPFGCGYRMIDFALSNMINSGIGNVCIIADRNCSSLMNHLKSGKEWDLHRKKNSLYIISPYSVDGQSEMYEGSLDSLKNAVEYARSSTQEYIILSGANIICNIDLDEALKYHINKDADITIIYKEEKDMIPSEFSKHTILCTEDDRITNVEVCPKNPTSSKIFMKMCIIKKSLFDYLVTRTPSRNISDFLNAIILNNTSNLKIYGFQFKGYFFLIDSLQSYYKSNMALLKPEVMEEIFFKHGIIHTSVKDEVPTKYGSDAVVENSLVAGGCIINGIVKNSIIFKGVTVDKGAEVTDSIIMKNCTILSESCLNNVILYKNVVIKSGKKITGKKPYPVAGELPTT